MMKMKKRKNIVVFTFVLSMLLLVSCGTDTEETSNLNKQEVVEQTTNQENKKEIPIYSINDTSLEKEQIYIEIDEITPNSIVESVVTALNEHSLEIGIDSVTMEEDTVIVSFLFGKAPLSSVGSGVEETILNSIAYSLLDNVEDCKKVIFRAEGEAYESGHYAFEVDEVYASK